MAGVTSFKRIEPEAEPAMPLAVPASTVAKLVTLAERLTEELGFTVDGADVIGWLLRQREKPTAVIVDLPADLPAEQTAAPEWHADIKQLMQGGRKIDAIKLVREKTAMSLKDCRDWVESQDWS